MVVHLCTDIVVYDDEMLFNDVFICYEWWLLFGFSVSCIILGFKEVS